LFSRPPLFIAGVVTAQFGLVGSLFAAPPTFISGVFIVPILLAGIPFVAPPTFITGTFAFQFQTVAGVLFLRPPLFLPAGTVTREVFTPAVGLRDFVTGTRDYSGVRTYSS